jgi:hypothetical protein
VLYDADGRSDEIDLSKEIWKSTNENEEEAERSDTLYGTIRGTVESEIETDEDEKEEQKFQEIEGRKAKLGDKQEQRCEKAEYEGEGFRGGMDLSMAHAQEEEAEGSESAESKIEEDEDKRKEQKCKEIEGDGWKKPVTEQGWLATWDYLQDVQAKVEDEQEQRCGKAEYEGAEGNTRSGMNLSMAHSQEKDGLRHDVFKLPWETPSKRPREGDPTGGKTSRRRLIRHGQKTALFRFRSEGKEASGTKTAESEGAAGAHSKAPTNEAHTFEVVRKASVLSKAASDGADIVERADGPVKDEKVSPSPASVDQVISKATDKEPKKSSQARDGSESSWRAEPEVRDDERCTRDVGRGSCCGGSPASVRATCEQSLKQPKEIVYKQMKDTEGATNRRQLKGVNVEGKGSSKLAVLQILKDIQDKKVRVNRSGITC